MSEQPQDLDAEMQAILDAELAAAGLSEARVAPACACTPQLPIDAAQRVEERAPAPAPDLDTSRDRFRRTLADLAAIALKIPPERLDVRENMSRYGVDSIIVTELMKRISDALGLPIAPTVFFEARNLEELADILHQRYAKSIARLYAEPAAAATHDVAENDSRHWMEKFRSMAAQSAPAKPAYEPVAIIAMDGRFAESADLDALQRHLENGDDCIREIPSERWSWREVFGDPRTGEWTNVKYGGFTPDIDKFDPTFFGLSPRDAELMDPQHRLFIECVWRLIEQAGYAPKQLAGRKVGLFIGVNLQDYAHLVDRAGAIEAAHLTSLGHMFCPNRLSFLLDIHGPSQVIDTACSSSLVALHRATLAIQHEGCEMAIAGGANLLISPDMHIMYSKLGMICEDGRCKTFSKSANGYVRGDGVGAVLLKSLSRAERDGDTILAVIRGSAENHGGLSTSLTAPNPKAQASLIVEAHTKAGIDPRSIGTIECHGTGTSLGDPIEINGLKMAFEELYRAAGLPIAETPTCGLGSIKSNIGHAETAAGIAGVIKTVLALRSKRLYPTLHASDVNPMIELQGSPFYILQQGRSWPRPVVDGREEPRRAGVSSFGAGGSNAHVVIEEYAAKPPVPAIEAPQLVLLSARTAERLQEVVRGLHRFLDNEPAPDLADIAYTLQVGREPMAERLALVASSVKQLRLMLGRIDRGDEVPDCVRGTVKRRDAAKLARDDASPETIANLFAARDFGRLADLWTKGAEIDWQPIYTGAPASGRAPRRVVLPTYPFARQRYWLPDAAAGQPDSRRRGTHLHPLLHHNTSELGEQQFTSVFSGREFFLADHVVMGEKVLPGVAYLEMARAAVKQASPAAERSRVYIRLKNVVWARPFAVGDRRRPLHIGLVPQPGHAVSYRIYSTSPDRDGETILHSQGTATLHEETPSDTLDIAALREQIAGDTPERRRLDGARCYAAFRAMGLAYGPGHQGLVSVYYSDAERAATHAPQVLAKLALPAASERGAAQYVLHPGLVDSALQACIGLLPGTGHTLPIAHAHDAQESLPASLPFALESLEFLAAPAPSSWAWIRYADGSAPSDKVQKLDIDIADDDGNVCVRMRGFSCRSYEPAKPAQSQAMLICRPQWVDEPAPPSTQAEAYVRHHVVVCDLDSAWTTSVERSIARDMEGVSCERVSLSGPPLLWFSHATIQILETIKRELGRKDTARTLIQVVTPGGSGEAALLAGLSGLLKTANRESTRIFTQLIELDDGAAAAAKLLADGHSQETQVRHVGDARRVVRWREASEESRSRQQPWKDNGVYLITGGGGGLGLLFAGEIARHTRNAAIVLSGRSAPDANLTAELDRLSAAGLHVQYRQCDVAKRTDVAALVSAVVRTHGRIDGVLHGAGLLRDNFIAKKTAAEVAEVLAPKVAGTLNLDSATAHLDLDFLALFSSAAGAFGSSGQADYAAANAFLDAFARHRNAEAVSGRRRGRTVSIDWPLWAEGGMQMEPAALAMMRQTTGIEPLPTEAGLSAFSMILASGSPHALVLYGEPALVRKALEPSAQAPVSPKREEVRTETQADTAGLARGIERMLLEAVASLMKFDIRDLEPDAEWNDYGFDSISLTDFSNRLNQKYRLDLTPTVFFEHSTAAALAAWLASEHGVRLAEALDLLQPDRRPKPSPAPRAPAEAPQAQQAADAVKPASHGAKDTAVAIIGISGRFPMAPDLDAFWANLIAGRDCIGEIPPDRWDWRALWGDPAADANKTDIKWGGFIDNVGDFDARFFNISAREAQMMDPQQRLLMQYAWKAIEDAGYSAGSLAGTTTAMLVGTASSGYGEMLAKSGSAIESHSSTGVVGSIGPNRMSYFLNLHGPSEPIETACSSSLVAIHRALTAMASGDCDQAIVGGINLILSPETHVSFSKAGMLCPDGRCKTFSKDANGYVRGEGVGMLFLKKLSLAERDRDHIYAVIRGSAENHGGRGNSLTAPNPKAQAELIKTACTRAGIDPRTIGYIEAHGTGTALGDPIEINGLKTAFRDLYAATGSPDVASAHCGLGSVKTNIGHLELAAGIAGVIKVLLQLKHKMLVQSLHCEAVNPYIALEGSPFYLVRESRAWEPPIDDKGHVLPRRAGVSSFGFGGVNAHVVIEEYPEPPQREPATEGAELPHAIVLSAKDPDRLKAYAADLLAFISAQRGPEASLPKRGIEDAVRTLAAEVLNVEPGDIDPAQPLDEYGFEPFHRAMLGGRIAQALGIDNGASICRNNHSVAAIAAELGGANTAREPDHSVALADLAYTLQIGRDAMDARLAVLATSIGELRDKLGAFVRGETAAGLHVGQKDKSLVSAFSADDALAEAFGKWIEQGKLAKLLDLWVKGVSIEWEKLYGEGRPYPHRPRRIPAPGYPFAGQRYWIERKTEAATVAATAATNAALHPLLHENVSTLAEVRFRATLAGTEFFLADHLMQGHKVLPGVAYLEMVRAAICQAAPDTANAGSPLELHDVVWIAPAIVDRPLAIDVSLTSGPHGTMRYEVASGHGPERQIHSRGSASFAKASRPSRLDIAGMRARGVTPLDPGRCYEIFSAAGLDYGPGHRAITALEASASEALARLQLPASISETCGEYVLHPSLMDSALQTSIGLMLAAAAEKADSAPKLSLPFAVESVTIYGPCVPSMWAWVRRPAGAAASDRVQKLDIDLCDDGGQVAVAIRGFSSRLVEAKPPARHPTGTPTLRPASIDPATLESRTVAYFKALLADVLKFPLEEIRLDEPLESYGIDSMLVVELTSVLEKPFGALSKTLFFEHQTLGELVDHFLDAHRAQILALFDEPKAEAPVVSHRQDETGPPNQETPQPQPQPRRTTVPAMPRPDSGALDIAVIGLSGRYPQARDVDAYWKNLRDGRDCITEVPADRWNWRAFYGDGREGPGSHACKWGGFIEDADKFDPLFFNISPSAAEYMDPQERLFLEHAWMALEDSGYRREDLQALSAGSRDDEDLPAQVGVYAGVMYAEYQMRSFEASLGSGGVASTNFYASIANRVSYALNLHGPSMAVDTMCSSSLTAIHLACLDLKLGRTDLALAGGVNLNVHPNKYSLLSVGQFISGHGKCESFGAGGDGYVPSEGVGVVVLKRLAEAERDGDHVYGVIKASALNHGGKTNGYSVPNPKAQWAVIARALREAGIDPRAIGYVEAHGTGTRLGDPIEIAGLARALAKGMAGQRCWIGSSKSNIGHSEAAAGIAGLTKVLLQMREGEIAPSLHSKALNPNIDFSATPFAVNQELRAWPSPIVDGAIGRRAAGISSFGAGGSNAHLIVEEYVRPDAEGKPRHREPLEPAIIVLSARTEQQLAETAERLLAFVREHGGVSLRDMAFTLQIGREAMPHRLGFVARALDDVTHKLGRYLAGDTAAVHVGRARPGGGEPPAAADPEALVASWIAGTAVDWMRLYAGQEALPSRISLPTYPFARERYWVELPQSRGEPAVQAPIAITPQPPRQEIASDTLMLRPSWTPAPIAPAVPEPAYREHRVLAIGTVPDVPGAMKIPLTPDPTSIDSCFAGYAVQLFEEIKHLVQRKPSAPILVQVVVGPDAAASGCHVSLCGALAAMLKTARMENPQIAGQVIELDTAFSPSALAELLHDNGKAPQDQRIRYRAGRREVPTLAEMVRSTYLSQPVWRQGGTYLITGGAGGLGLIFAREIARAVGDVTLVLAGRSPSNAATEAAIAELRTSGARVDYRTADVSDAVAAHTLIGSFDGKLNGILHSAGIIRDGFILKKTATDVRDVLASKVSGVVNLDRASRSVDLDLFILFSSLAGAVGNPGQADYATANAFLDAYAAYRNALASGSTSVDAATPRPKGHALSINWPLWHDGGMDIAPEMKEAMWQTAGLRPLKTEAALAAFYAAIDSGCEHVMPLQGDVPRLRELFLPRRPETNAPAAAPTQHTHDRLDAHLVGETGKMIAKMLSDMLKLPLHRIEADVPLEQYGIDSVAMMKLTDDLEKRIGPVSKTLFFEHPTIEAVSAHLATSFEAELTQLFGLARTPAPTIARAPAPTIAPAPPKPEAVVRSVAGVNTPPRADAPRSPATRAAPDAGPCDIAVIGMAGRFPRAPDVETFWHNLASGRDAITEIPPDRWDHSLYFDANKDSIGKTYCKWGGFLDDVDRFDAAFFKISPSEAELLDPQERLFLETVWTLLESSGYLGETLQRLCQSRVGVFVGSMSQQYHAFDADLLRQSLVVMSSPSSIANRVSYFFNLQGPSIAVDTMCSASLNAVHMACESLLRSECKVAIAGGVNLTIHPKKYVGLSAGQMIGSHPDSTSFGDGDGYLPAEAVGAVLLKPLAEALSDGDTVLAVVKSTAVNHGGQSNGYRVPNGTAQAELIAGNFAKSGIDPRTVSYVESAANGSTLGDAIEVNALTAAFRRTTGDRQFCALGSVKSNIGHAEAASGITQLVKVILQLQHKKLVPTIKAEPLNPNIDLATTPFRLQRTLEDWRRPVLALGGAAAREYPRRATVSSFGAGGSNVHLIVDEHETSSTIARAEAPGPHLILLSAKTEAQRKALAQEMLTFLDGEPDVSIADLAYTLQTAREAMAYRIAIVAEDRQSLIGALRTHLAGGTTDGLFSGDTEQDTTAIRQLLSGKTGQATLAMLLEARDLDKLAVYWVNGARISWQPMHEGRAPRRISLPTYPFTRSRHWLPTTPAPTATPASPPAGSTAAFVLDPTCSLEDNIGQYLAHALGRLLAIPLDIERTDKTFLDYGVDSISATRLRRGIEQAFDVQISARDLVTHATPAALAKFAASQREAGQGSKKKSDSIAPVTFAGEEFPLSEGQKGLWLLHQMAPETSAYNVPIVLRLGAGLDAEAFRRACASLLVRFPILRSVFAERNGEPYQTINETMALAFTHEQTTASSLAEILDKLRAKSKVPFDLAHGPLLRVHLLSPGVGVECYALLTVHHMVIDGTSAVVLLKALMEDYCVLAAAGAAPASQVGTSYADFVRWQRKFLASERAAEQRAYWQAQLAGNLAPLPLPYDKPHPARQGFNGASREAILPAATSRALRAAAKALQVSPSTLFLGALKLLLHRFSGESDILVAMPTAGRPEPRFDDVLGYFVNMIVLRSQVTGPQTTAEFLKTLQMTMADGLDHADYPFPALLKDLTIERGHAGSALTQVVFAYQNFLQTTDTSAAQGPVSMDLLPGVNQEGGHDLALEVYDEHDSFRLTLCYDTDLFGADTIERTLAHYVRLLEQFTSDPDAPLARHTLLSTEEGHRILEHWSGANTEAAVDHSASVIDLFDRQAALAPGRIALVFGSQTLSYRDLDLRSRQLAHVLTERGIAAGDAVAVVMGRGPGMIVALLAIWRAGAIYVPIAPDSPAERVRTQLGDCGAGLLVADALTRNRMIAAELSLPLLVIDGAQSQVSHASSGPPRRIAAENPAYIIYTSGSTGAPKGVVISHRSIAGHTQGMVSVYGLKPEDKVLQFASMTVDASLEQILPGLIAGATLVVRPDPVWSASAFADEVARLSLTVLDLPPSYLHELLSDVHAKEHAFASVRLVIVGGEALTPETLRLWRKGPMRHCRLLNAYGPTETTITSAVHEIEPAHAASVDVAGPLPIGRPLPGERAYILDPDGQPVPFGVPGDLHIGGAGLAIGYLNLPELTRQAFIDNPARPGERVYRTGDRARWNADGTIVFLGRRDHQVKVRGFRIEIGEVEAALRSLETLAQAAVVLRPLGDREQLVAFVVPADDCSVPKAVDLKQALAAKLPSHMIPAAICTLGELPHTPAGKIDRTALMRADIEISGAQSHTAPRSETETRLVGIWQRVLGIDRIGITDSFFDLGGHSLLAVRLTAHIHKEFGRDFPISSLLNAPDIAAQAKLLDTDDRNWSPLVCLDRRGQGAPFFCVHAVSGDVLAYRDLARAMGQARPFYALRAPDVAGGRHPGTIEGLAALYVDAIRSVQPEGPYHLGGWSLGGTVAYEMSCRLQRAGHEVASLALIDSYTPQALHALAIPSDAFALRAAFARELEPEDAAAFLTPSQGLASAHLERMFAVFEANARALAHYVPGAYRGSAALFVAEGTATGTFRHGGWSEVIDGDLATVAIPGDHYSAVRPPNVAELAAALVRYISSGDQTHGQKR
jgi:amino acid adenylation domain-containing protein